MARKKEYLENEVVEKAMNLFWKNGYETTSMQMLEKEMGINKFSIYSSFGSKNGLFIESLKCYKSKLNQLIDKLKNSESGVNGIKKYFYDFIEFSKENDIFKGCLITNTANEIKPDSDETIKKLLADFTNDVKNIFALKLKSDDTKSETMIEEQADYLIIAMFGLSSATKVFNKNQLDHYIQNTFKNI